MQEISRITKEELLNNMKVLSSIYDVVRFVEPESAGLVTFGEDGKKLKIINPVSRYGKKIKDAKIVLVFEPVWKSAELQSLNS